MNPKALTIKTLQSLTKDEIQLRFALSAIEKKRKLLNKTETEIKEKILEIRNRKDFNLNILKSLE